MASKYIDGNKTIGTTRAKFARKEVGSG